MCVGLPTPTQAPSNGVWSWQEDTWRGVTTYTVNTQSLNVVMEIIDWFQSLPDEPNPDFGGTIKVEGQTTSFICRSGWFIKIATLPDEYMTEFKLRWML